MDPLLPATAPFDGTVTLDDKYVSRSGRVFLSGTQALVRLPLLQARRDRERGLKTAGFISGYRGSPLANYDTALWGAKKWLDEAGVVFQPGLNEELAATAVWGTQQVTLRPGAKVDGVFGIWYAKGPGVDRSMDALKHANAAGTSALGGVLAVFGDDHGAQSSTMLHQSEFMFEAAWVPVLNPSDIHEHILFGLHGFELSRYAGCWVGLKATTEIVESSASVAAGDPPLPVMPTDDPVPTEGLGIRWPDRAADQETRMCVTRMAAIAAFARANPIDRQELAAGPARFGIATTGKAYNDVRQALADLGIGEPQAEELGIRLYKIGMSWPIETRGALRFAAGLEEILVVEEKRAFIEPQLAAALRHAADAPRIIGKADVSGAPLLPSHGELSPPMIARVIASRLQALGIGPAPEGVWPGTDAGITVPVVPVALSRTPFFCSGCPHNSSTKVPDGSRAFAGTGCHSMSMYVPDRNAAFLTQMGGEGVNWIGQAPFAGDRHVFVNLGDGTFSHSGQLAIRAAAAAGVNATYKILFNDAVAMTGGQENDAHLTVSRIAHQVHAEGAKRVAVLSERPERHDAADFPPGTELLDRSELDRVQRELREMPGLTVIIYDQVCAAEKRRRRKRGKYPAGPKRVFINEAVCEACGDCSVQSNCISVAPVDTPLGRKRKIDQSSCNADYSCLNGFCPSFVTVEGAVPRKHKVDASRLDPEIAALPSPICKLGEGASNILVTGIGGTGVVTVSALLGMAAHLEGKAVTTLDYTGLAQKNGAVISHVRIAMEQRHLGPARMPTESADLVLACDAVVAASLAALTCMSNPRTQVVANTHVQPPGAFVLNTRIDLDSEPSIAALSRVVGDHIETLDATRLAVQLLGDSLFANLFMLGFACQSGALPVGIDALQRAIELNGSAVPANKRAFALGRLAASRKDAFSFLADEAAGVPGAPLSLESLIADRRGRVAAYQDEAYAARFERLVRTAEAAETKLGLADRTLTEAVARNFHKLLCYKDEYEVARLYAEGDFERKIADAFEPGGKRTIYLAPPLLSRRDPVTGRPRKVPFGPWVFTAFKMLARLKRLRGTPFDPFGHTGERKRERGLIAEYEATIRLAIGKLGPHNAVTVTALAELPDTIRGFGPVKHRNMEQARHVRAGLVSQLEADGLARPAIAPALETAAS